MKITEFKSIWEEAEVKVKKKFALHIPKALAERLDLREGGKMSLCIESDKLILEPLRRRDTVELAVKGKKFASVSFEEVETRKEEKLKEFFKGVRESK
jgi:AbrB family looped-hinge helix DNA binding protein